MTANKKCPGKECCLDRYGFFSGCYDPYECESCSDGVIIKNDPEKLKVHCKYCNHGFAQSYCDEIAGEKCCYGICYNDACFRCDELTRRVKPKCPSRPSDPNTKCCLSLDKTTGTCYGSDKCQECVDGEVKNKVREGSDCKICCPTTGVCVDPEKCQECPDGKSKCSGFDYCCGGNCCDPCKKCVNGQCGEELDYDPFKCQECVAGKIVNRCSTGTRCCGNECVDLLCDSCGSAWSAAIECGEDEECCKGKCHKIDRCKFCMNGTWTATGDATNCELSGKTCCSGGGCYDSNNKCESCGPSGVTVDQNCCNKQPFDPGSQECCPGGTGSSGEQLPDTVVPKGQCSKCNDQYYDPAKYGCCKGFVETLYNLVSQGCCDGGFVYNIDSEGCCGNTTYKKFANDCCGTTVIPKDLKCSKCEDGALVPIDLASLGKDPRCYTCKEGSALSGGGIRPKCEGFNIGCCGGACYKIGDNKCEECVNGSLKQACPEPLDCCNGECGTESVCKKCGYNDKGIYGWVDKCPQGYLCCPNGTCVPENTLGCIGCDGVVQCSSRTDGNTSCCDVRSINGTTRTVCYNPACSYCDPNSGPRTRPNCKDCCNPGTPNETCCENVCCGDPVVCCANGEICSNGICCKTGEINCGGVCCKPDKCINNTCCSVRCNDQCMDPETQICCNNTIYDKNGCNQCCNGTCIDSGTQCCEYNGNEYICAIDTACCNGTCCEGGECCNGSCCSSGQICCGGDSEFGGCITPPCEVCKNNQPAPKCADNETCCNDGSCVNPLSCDTCSGPYIPSNPCCYCVNGGEYCDPDCDPPPPPPPPGPPGPPPPPPPPPPPGSGDQCYVAICYGCSGDVGCCGVAGEYCDYCNGVGAPCDPYCEYSQPCKRAGFSTQEDAMNYVYTSCNGLGNVSLKVCSLCYADTTGCTYPAVIPNGISPGNCPPDSSFSDGNGSCSITYKKLSCSAISCLYQYDGSQWGHIGTGLKTGWFGDGYAGINGWLGYNVAEQYSPCDCSCTPTINKPAGGIFEIVQGSACSDK